MVRARRYYLLILLHPVHEGVEVSQKRCPRPGDTVRVSLRPGAFRIAWYQIASCGD